MSEQEMEKLRAFEQAIFTRLTGMYGIAPGDEEAVALAARLAAVRLYEMRRSDDALADERMINAGSAEAYYQYVLYRGMREDNVTDFTAGDVSYTLGGRTEERARLYRDQLMAQARSLLCDSDDFWFRRV